MIEECNPIELCNVDDQTLIHWKDVLSEEMMIEKVIHLISDTETTGTELSNNDDTYNRVLEWSMVFCKEKDGIMIPIRDKDNRIIALDEVLNPFVEKSKTEKQRKSIKKIPKETTNVHGITLDYLFGGKEGLYGRVALPHQAVTFDVFYEKLMFILCSNSFLSNDCEVHMHFYNAPFDFKFLTQEFSIHGLPPMESMFFIQDAKKLAEKTLNKKLDNIPNVKLDSIYEWAKNTHPTLCNNIDRNIHTALIDSLILMDSISCLNVHRQKKIAEKML